MKKPKTLYRFDMLVVGKKKISKHRTTAECCPQIEIFSENFNRGHLWRCKCKQGDFYGYDNIVDARHEEIENTKKRIYEDKQWLEMLIR